MLKRMIVIFALPLLPSCVSASLSSHADIEEYPLRPATRSESARLKTCLRAAHAADQKEGQSARRASDLPVDALCQGFFLGIAPTPNGREIMAQFHENESTVRWTINEEGVIEEHLEPEINEDLDF